MSHLARSDSIDSSQVDIVENNPEAGVGKSDAEGQPHVPTTAHDRDVYRPVSLGHPHNIK